MGVLINRSEDAELYKDAYEEAQRIIRISDEVRISLERVTHESESHSESNHKPETEGKSEVDAETGKLTSSKLATKLGYKKSGEFIDKLVAAGYLEAKDGKHFITSKGKESGGEFRMSPKFGAYFLWPENIKL
jgi:hypothetical protein